MSLYGPRVMPKVGVWANRYNLPDRMICIVPGLDQFTAASAAQRAAKVAAILAPKVSGGMADRIRPVFGPGFYGVWWADQHTWFQEHGTKPFTMRRLAGKTVPMWINDPDGKVRQENPKAKTRVTADGRQQTLIFRRAAKIGQRKVAWRRRGGVDQLVDVPASYPGAPGRINKRISQAQDGHRPGQIAPTNVGVRWRHPGLGGMRFIETGLQDAAEKFGLSVAQTLTLQGDRII